MIEMGAEHYHDRSSSTCATTAAPAHRDFPNYSSLGLFPHGVEL